MCKELFICELFVDEIGVLCVQVFGSVSKGMDVVKQIESYGSASGKTSKKIVVAVCTLSLC